MQNQFGLVSLGLGTMAPQNRSRTSSSNLARQRGQSNISQLQPIEERYESAMTKEQKLIITYISLLILQTRHQFALRAINLIGQQLVNQLICHANLTKLYGLCLLQSKQERIKEAFELFRRAKKQFKLIGGAKNKTNLGVAQLYMIEATLLRTKSEQIFAPNQPSELIVMKKSQKRFEAAKQIYKLREHLAGQQFCCQELMHVYKVLGIRHKSVQNELKELQQKLKTAYTNDNRLFCGSSHVFVLRTEGLEHSLMIEIIDSEVIVQPVPKPRSGSKQIKISRDVPRKQVFQEISSSAQPSGASGEFLGANTVLIKQINMQLQENTRAHTPDEPPTVSKHNLASITSNRQRQKKISYREF